MADLVRHVATLYGERAERRYYVVHSLPAKFAHLSPEQLADLGWDTEEETRRVARVTGDIETSNMTAQLHSTKRATLDHLHTRLHEELGEPCFTNGEDYFATLITESLSSLEDVMATAKKATVTKEKSIKVEIRYVPDALLGEVWAKAQMGLPEGFLDVDKMDLIDQPGFIEQRRAANHPRNLETVYNYYQKIDGAPEERTDQLKVRSMSTGDAIVIAGVAYYVATKGFVTKAADGSIVPVEVPEA